MEIEKQLKNFILICGHYGCGKTNFALNLAFDMRSRGRDVTVVDMDLVNPYFRTSDYRGILEEQGIHVTAPNFGATNLDIPSLPAEMYSIFENKDTVIVDVGGDDVGATVLGRFYPKLKDMDYDFLYVVNRFRNLTSTPEDSVQVLREIEAVSRLKATKLVNNSHLMQETTGENIYEGISYAKRVSSLTGLPILCTTVRRDLASALKEDEDSYYRMDIRVKTVWS